MIFDLKCKTTTGEEILIEMQNESQDFFENRIIYYMARAISNQGFKEWHKKNGEDTKDIEDDKNNDTKIQKEEWKFQINRVIGIFIMNFYDPKEPNKISRNCWTNVETGRITSDRQEYWKVQLPYFRSHNMKMEDCTSKSDYWLYNFANMGTMENIAFKGKDTDFVYLSDLAEFRAMTIPEQDNYIRMIDREVVYNNSPWRKSKKFNHQWRRHNPLPSISQLS
ncbi:MAG: Rpn family recombination-promoting nuclease/putative transposase [Bacteroidales bacterium]|nr:Rpn family recombination-promoting nuclease/putative transposase [Bacteroidales bacterium]